MRKMLLGVTVAVCLSIPFGVAAHFCSNIFVAHSKLVVQAEKTSVVVGSSPTTLRVYLQNNFPFKIRWVEMRGVATGYTVTVSPGPIDIFPGQRAGFVFTISGPAATLPVTTLNLQVRFRDDRFNSYPPNGVSGWKELSYFVVNQNPTLAELVTGYANQLRDSNSMIAATMADKYPTGTLSASAPTFGRTGIQQLIKMFGYRFCWTPDFQWRCGAQDCPSPCAEGTPWTADWQFANNCMRAGAELAIRKAVLGSELAAAQAGSINAMKAGGSESFKCLAAIVGGYLHQGASSTSAFTAALQSPTNAVPLACQNAGLRVLDGSNASNCSSGQFYEQAACAGAEGLRGNDGPVNNVLKPNALDNCTPTCTFTSEGPGLFHAYMLYLVANHRRATVGHVSFYPDAGSAGCSVAGDCDDGNVCTTNSCNGGSCQFAPITGCCTQSSQCNDSNVCTTDTCNTTSHTCQFAPITGCCTQSSQCNDSNLCTTDTCNATTHVCQFAPISNCCTESSQCNDGNACTSDSCNTTTHLCQFTPLSGCCTSNAQCADSDPCTTDTCNTANGVCSNVKQTGCCLLNSECNDGNVCTSDTCNTTSHACQFAPIADCCTLASQCDDGNVCTADTCDAVSHACQHSAITGCCTSSSQCDDGSACTTDTCNATTHLCEHTPFAGCCSTDADCADNDPCTKDTCSTADGSCRNEKQASCCTYDTQCDDGDACTLDRCDTTTHACGHTNTCGDLGPGGDLAAAPEQGSTPQVLQGGCACGVQGATSPPWAAGVLVLLLGGVLHLVRVRVRVRARHLLKNPGHRSHPA